MGVSKEDVIKLDRKQADIAPAENWVLDSKNVTKDEDFNWPVLQVPGTLALVMQVYFSYNTYQMQGSIRNK